MDIVIVGSGKVGFSLAEQLVKEEHNVTVVDSDEEALRRAGDQLDIMTVRGNGVSAAVLREAGVDKAEGIDRLLARFGIGLDETMAFGDGGNDIPMLRHVGTGVAMGNADGAVKAEADYVTTSVDEEGIARALRHFGLID